MKLAHRLGGPILLGLALSASAEPAKVLRYILPAAETSFDPAVSRDLYTGHITQAIFDTLFTYDYLARPPRCPRCRRMDRPTPFA
jgi:ABC-type transport system substrate-binding protein